MSFKLDSGVLTEVWRVITSFFELFTTTSLGYLVVALIAVTAMGFVFSVIGGR